MKTFFKDKIMKTRMRFIPGLLLIFSVAIFAGCSDDEEVTPMSEKNIVEVASDAGNFSMLIEAAQKAGLAGFLSTRKRYYSICADR